MLGFPGDTRETIQETIHLAQSLPCTFAVFNLYVPRVGSVLREEVVRDEEQGAISALDSSGRPPSYCRAVSSEDLADLRREAYQSFYLHPGRAVRIARTIRTPTEMRQLLRNLAQMFRKY